MTDDKCNESIRGPLGSVVGYCELTKGHIGSCKVNGVSEQDMVDCLSSFDTDDGTTNAT